MNKLAALCLASENSLSIKFLRHFGHMKKQRAHTNLMSERSIKHLKAEAQLEFRLADPLQ